MYSSYEEELERTGNLVYTNVGDSMMPLLRQNRDLMIFVKKGAQRCKKYDAVLYKRPATGQYVMHRILKVRENDYVICGDNRWSRERGVTDDQILAIMTGVIRDGKKISVTDFKYQLYVHLWCDFFWIRGGILWLRHKIRIWRRK